MRNIFWWKWQLNEGSNGFEKIFSVATCDSRQVLQTNEGQRIKLTFNREETSIFVGYYTSGTKVEFACIDSRSQLRGVSSAVCDQYGSWGTFSQPTCGTVIHYTSWINFQYSLTINQFRLNSPNMRWISFWWRDGSKLPQPTEFEFTADSSRSLFCKFNSRLPLFRPSPRPGWKNSSKVYSRKSMGG